MGKPEPGSVKTTTWQQVVAAVFVGTGIGWLIFAVPNGFGWPLPAIPLIASLALLGFAVVVAVLARKTHRSIQRRRDPIQPVRAVRLLVLGKSALLAGAGLAAGYLAAILYSLPHWAAVLPRERIVNAAIAMVASIGLAIGGHFLERACRIPGPPSGDATPGGLPGSPASPH